MPEVGIRSSTYERTNGMSLEKTFPTGETRMIGGKMRRWILFTVCLAALGFSLVQGYTKNSPSSLEREEEKSWDTFVYDSTGLRDPFLPLIIPTPTVTATRTITPIATPTLEGGGTPTNTPTSTPTPVELPYMELQIIMATETGGNVAVINDRLLHEGDSIGDVVIREILSHEVIVEYLGVEFVLPPPTIEEAEEF